MVKQILLISGPVASGKTTLSRLLKERFGIHTFKTREYLRKLKPEVEAERTAMQEFGERLDRKTKGEWVCEGLERFIRSEAIEDSAIVAVDAVRIAEQIAAVRRAYGPRVVHVHLDAPLDTLTKRYAGRSDDVLRELPSYEEVQKNPTERKVGKLREKADVVIDTRRCAPKDVMVKAASFLGFYGREYLRLVDVLVGGQYGSEGKGHIASYLAREYDVLVRVGGPNAGHTVFSESPITFHHLPSGSLSSPNALLVIGAGATIFVPELLREMNSSSIEAGRLVIDPQAMIISEEDREWERKHLAQTMGSTAQGVGAAAARRIKWRKPGEVKLARDLRELKPFMKETCEVLEDAYRAGERVLLEGTQGTGLSLYHGTYPYVTSRDTTVAGCLAEAGISPSRTRKVIVVCRTYPIRVESPEDATSGPMGREIDWSEVETRSRQPAGTLAPKELTSTTRRKRRVGEFEWISLRKAASLNAPTDIALTFVDYIHKQNERARRFEQLTSDTIRFIEEVERVAAAPVSLISTRFDYRSIIDRRSW